MISNYCLKEEILLDEPSDPRDHQSAKGPGIPPPPITRNARIQPSEGISESM
jgi:hypothetical protein